MAHGLLGVAASPNSNLAGPSFFLSCGSFISDFPRARPHLRALSHRLCGHVHAHARTRARLCMRRNFGYVLERARVCTCVWGGVCSGSPAKLDREACGNEAGAGGGQVCWKSAKVQLNSGVLMRRHEKWEEALQHFRLARALEPSYCEPAYWIGITLLQQRTHLKLALQVCLAPTCFTTLPMLLGHWCPLTRSPEKHLSTRSVVGEFMLLQAVFLVLR